MYKLTKKNRLSKKHKRSKKSFTKKHHHKGGCGCSNPFFGDKKQYGGCGGTCVTAAAVTLLGGKKHRQKGGNCGCSLIGGKRRKYTHKHKGGATPLVGGPWTEKIDNWPGVSGEAGVTNHYKLNSYNNDIQTAMLPARGGARRKRGGSGITKILPDAIVNIGRDIGYGVGSAYNNIKSIEEPVNPTPYEQPYL